MNQFLLPDTVDIFGVTFLINGVTLSIAVIPMLWLLFVGLYIHRIRMQGLEAQKQTDPPQLSEFSNSFYQYERSFAPGVDIISKGTENFYDYGHGNGHGNGHAQSANNYADFFTESPPLSNTSRSSRFPHSKNATSQSDSNRTVALDIEDIELIPLSRLDGYYADELTRPVEIPAFVVKPIAYLELVDDDEHLPPKFVIGGDDPVRFGRRKSLCDHLIEDMRVSRLHATLVPYGDSISIRDEGSSGGTFVNHRRLGLSDEIVLKDQDIISFNDISYQIAWVG